MKLSKIDIECLWDVDHFSKKAPSMQHRRTRGYKTYQRPKTIKKLESMGLVVVKSHRAYITVLGAKAIDAAKIDS